MTTAADVRHREYQLIADSDRSVDGDSEPFGAGITVER
jgi:hypothetical protein